MATRDVQIYFKVDGLEQYITSLEELDQVLKQVKGATDEVNNATDSLQTSTESFDDLEKRLGTMEGATKALAGGLEFLAGSAGLLGLEDNPFFAELQENTLNILALARGAIDMAEGYSLLRKNLDLATVAQLKNNAAALANPYVLLAAAILAAGAALVIYMNSTEDTTEATKDQLRAIEDLNQGLLDQIDFEEKLAEARGQSTTDTEFNRRRINELQRSNDELSLTIGDLISRYSDLSDEEKELLKTAQDDVKANNDKINNLNQENLLIEERRKTKEREAEEEARIEREREQRRRAEERRNAQARLEAELTLKAIEDDRERELEILRRKYEEEIKLAEGNAKLIKLINEQLQRDINDTNAKYAAQRIDPIKPVQQDIIRTQELIISTNNVVAQSSTEVADAWGLSYRKAFDAYVEDPGKATDLLKRDTKAALDFVNNLNTIFTKDNEKRAERAFKIAKALSLSTAVINTAEGITKALTDPTQPSTILRILQTAAVAAAGAAQIATITRQQYGGNAQAPTPPSPGGALATPQINYNFTQNAGEVLTPGGVQSEPVRAYVLVSDVNSAQQANNQIERYSRL